MGSSPRLRGTPSHERHTARHAGIIPALAGNTARGFVATFPHRDHPRACGEHGHAHSRAHVILWIIPALAGNTPSSGAGGPIGRDHPRACGEHVGGSPYDAKLVGSSPRLRGTQGGYYRIHTADGIIPALAGNTIPKTWFRTYRRDHPRACGEHLTDTPPHPCTRGSSPRLRGTRDCERPLCFSNLRSAL